LACAIVSLIQSSGHLGLRSYEIRELLYGLSEQDWLDEPADDGQLSLFPKSFRKEVKK